MNNLSIKISEALNKEFRPEFLNRIDEVIQFRPLLKEDLKRIVKLYLDDLSKLLSEQDLKLRFNDETIDLLATQGYEPEYGARPLRRVIRRKLENPLASKLLEEHFRHAVAVRVQPDMGNKEALLFIPESS